MVPASYHGFFSDIAEIAGTLIGLLFVAVSVAPEKLRGSDIDFQVKAGMAFGVLSNALAMALLAQIPGDNLATAGIFLSATGLSSTLGLGLLGLRHRSVRLRLRVLVRITFVLGIFAVQLYYALDLDAHPNRGSAVEAISYILIASFAFAIERAWELVGADGSGLLSLAARQVVQRSSFLPDSDPDGEAKP